MDQERSDLINRLPEDDDSPDMIVNMRDTQSNAYSASDAADDSDDRDTDDGATDETEKIRSQIESTRSEMSETIDAIQEKLSVANITEQVKEEVNEQISSAWKAAKDTVYETTMEKVGTIMGYVNKGLNEASDTQIVKTAQRSPIAVSLIGLGVGMLIYNSYYKRSSGTSGYNRNKRALSSTGANQTSTLANAQDKVTDAASQAYGTVTGAASQAYSSVGNVAGQAYETVENFGSQVKDTASDLASKAHDQYDYYIEENPLAVGAVAMAVGAAVGFSIPSTRYESQLVGETRDRLVNQTSGKIGDFIRTAGEAAQEKYDSIKTVAEKTMDTAVNTAKDEAKNQDLV